MYPPCTSTYTRSKLFCAYGPFNGEIAVPCFVCVVYYLFFYIIYKNITILIELLNDDKYYNIQVINQEHVYYNPLTEKVLYTNQAE